MMMCYMFLRNRIGRNIYYLVHLTYSAQNADGFPRYEEFAGYICSKRIYRTIIYRELYVIFKFQFIGNLPYPQWYQKGGDHYVNLERNPETSWRMTTCAWRSGAASSILPPATGKAMTKQAGRPFDWTAWRCCEATTMPMNRTTGTAIRPCGGEGVGEDDPKAPFRLAHEGTLNDGCFDNVFSMRRFTNLTTRALEKSLVSENPFVRIFALLDRRLGSAACWLWRNPWSRSWTGCGPLCDPDAGRRAAGTRIT